MKKIQKLFYPIAKYLLLIASFLFFAPRVMAQAPSGQQSVWNGIRDMILPIGKIGYGYPSGVPTDIRIIAMVVIKIFIMVIIIVFFCLFFYGGFTYMTAAGDENKVDKGKDTLKTATIGLVIIFTSYAITRFIILAAVCAVSQYSDWCLFFVGIT